MRRLAPLIFAVLTFALAGCPVPTYGLHRQSNSEPVVVGYDCVKDKIGAIAGVENLVYDVSEGGRPLTLSGVKPADSVHHFSFQSGGEEMDVWLTERWDGKVEYLGWAQKPDKNAKADMIELAAPLYSQIEAGIQACGYDNLTKIAFGTDL